MDNITATAQNIIAVASNVAQGSNPSFTAADFLAVFPQFSAADPDVTLIPDDLLDLFIAMADASIKENLAKMISGQTDAQGFADAFAKIQKA